MTFLPKTKECQYTIGFGFGCDYQFAPLLVNIIKTLSTNGFV